MIFVHAGVVTDDEFLSFYKALCEDNRFDKSFNMLVDLRQTESVERSAAALHGFAHFVQQQYRNTTARPKVAVVAPGDVSFGLARMYEFFSNTAPFDFVVFRAVDAALAWLGVPDTLLDNLEQDTQPEDTLDS